MDVTNSELLVHTLITTVATQAGRIEQLRGASNEDARLVAMKQFLQLLTATGSPAPGWVRTFDTLMRQEFPQRVD